MITIRKQDELLVYGEVYVPYRLDTDNEYMTPEEIQKAAYAFMGNSEMGNVDTDHSFEKGKEVIVENYIAKDGDEEFIPGSWIAVGLVTDPERIQMVKDGKLNGWSMAGSADKIPRTVKVTALKSAPVETEMSTSEAHIPHTHTFKIEFDEHGHVKPSKTEMNEGHAHTVIMTTATEPVNGHAHRFNVDWNMKSPGIEAEERTVEAAELVNVKPKWLSLVEHAAARRAFKVIKEDTDKAEWTTAFINSLPNSSFAVIETGYKDGDSKSARHLPYKDSSGKIDKPHLQNALARMNQIKAVLGNDTDAELRARAERVLGKYSAKEEEEIMDRVVHAIVLDGIEYDDAALLPDLEWMGSSALKIEERIRIGKTNKCVVIPAEKFISGSIALAKTADDRVRLMVGTLKNADDLVNVVTVEEKKMDEKMVLELIEKAVGEKFTGLTADLEAIKGLLTKAADEKKEEKPVEKAKAPESDAAETSEDKLITQIQALVKELAAMKSEHTETIKKLDSLAAKAATTSGTQSEEKVDQDEVKKMDPENPWTGRFFTNMRNAKIQAVLNS